MLANTRVVATSVDAHPIAMCEVELVIDRDLPFSYAYTIGCADKIGVEFVIAGMFEPIEYHNYLAHMIPTLLKRWHVHNMNAKLNERVAALGVLTRHTPSGPEPAEVELQLVHQSYINALMFPNLPLHATVVQIVIFDENGKLPGDPAHIEDAQPDLFSCVVDNTEDSAPATTQPCIQITGFDIEE